MVITTQCGAYVQTARTTRRGGPGCRGTDRVPSRLWVRDTITKTYKRGVYACDEYDFYDGMTLNEAHEKAFGIILAPFPLNAANYLTNEDSLNIIERYRRLDRVRDADEHPKETR